MLNPENIDKVVFEIRGVPVMLDLQAAFIYNYKLEDLRTIVSEKLTKFFPNDFMFELKENEINDLIEQNIVKLEDYADGGFAFSEQGIAMLSMVIPTPKALAVGLDIMRAYARHTDWLREDEKSAEIKSHIQELDVKYNQAFQFLLDKIEKGGEAQTPRNPIGFKSGKV